MSHASVWIVLASVAGFISSVHCFCSVPGSPFYLHENSGVVQSPGYPESYRSFESCDWELKPPPRTHPEVLIVDLVQVDTDVGGLPLTQDVCDKTDSFVAFGGVRACDREESVCVSFMLSTASIECHNILATEYSSCHSALQTSWPFHVNFRTGMGAVRAGFKLKYKFVTCSDSPHSEEPEETATVVLSQNVTTSGSGAEVPEETTVAATVPVTTTQGVQTTRTRFVTTLGALLTRETKASQVASAGASDEKVVIGVLIGLILFLVLVAAILYLYRKSILLWVENKKWSPSSTKDSTDGGVYTEAHTINNNNADGYEVPMRRPPMPPPYPPMTTENGKAAVNESENDKRTSLDGPLTITNTIYEVCE